MVPAADLVFWDVAGFSSLADQRQAALVNSFTDLVADQERARLAPKVGRPTAIALPTGDGCALAYLMDDGRVGFAAEALRLAVELLRWAANENPAVGLRIGLHRGVVTLITDINGRTNVCGDPINVCQRVMDAANEGQVLASNEFVAAHFGTGGASGNSAMSPLVLGAVGPAGPAPAIPQDDATVEELAAWRAAEADRSRPVSVRPLPPIHAVLAKHDRRLGVWVLGTDPDQGWDTKPPKSKDQVVVTIDDKPLSDFLANVRIAREIALVQLTGYRIADSLLSGEVELSVDLVRFWVLMPEVTAVPGYLRQESDATGVSVDQYLTKWRDAVAKVRVQRPRADNVAGTRTI